MFMGMGLSPCLSTNAGATAPEDDSMKPLASVSGISLHTVGLTNIYTVPAGKTLVVLDVVIRTQSGNPEPGRRR